MAGPWEAYGGTGAGTAQGPWSDFQPKKETTPVDTRPDAGVLSAIGRGAVQGGTLNFADELQALSEGAGRAGEGPKGWGGEQRNGIDHLLLGLYRYVTGDPEAKKRYDEVVARERDANKQAEEQHPIASTIGQFGGALALPIGPAAAGATLPARMLAGAGTGAAMGAIGGVGAGEGAADSVSRGATGLVAGGLLGAAAPAAIEGIIQGGRAIATPVANAIRGIRDPEGEAARRLAVAVERDARADPNAVSRVTPQEYAASNQSGGPVMNMDLGGETTRALARSAANTSPEGRGVLNRAIDDRFEGQTERVNNWLRDTFHYPDADAQQVALKQAASQINKPAYAKAYSEGDKQVWSPELERLTAAPMVQSALSSAMTKWKNYAVRDGYGAMNPPFRVENGGLIKQGGPGMKVYPNIQLWDYAARELQDAAREAAPGSQAAGLYNDLARAMKNELDNIVPSYKTAREGAAGFFKADNALEAGQNFVGQNFAEGETRRALAKMTPTERQLFQDGFVSRYMETLNQVGDRRSILNKIAESPAAREKLRIAIGTQRADQLEAGLRVEGIMDLARTAVQGNSTTARQLAELGLAGGAGVLGNGLDYNTVHPSALMSAALVYGAARGRGHINENVSRHVANLLTSRDPTQVTRGIRMIANNQTLFSALRGADQGLARITSSEAPALPAIQMGGVGRADDQNSPPRPPNGQ